MSTGPAPAPDGRLVQVAEADGNRTRLTRIPGHTGFEDREGHQAPKRLHDGYRDTVAHTRRCVLGHEDW